MSFAAYSSLFGGDLGVYQTVSALKRLVYQSLEDPHARIRLRAESILGATGEKDEEGEISALYDYVTRTLHYLGDPTNIELIKSPLRIDDEVSEKGFFMGDCDDASGYLAALLKSVGYQVQFVTVTPEDAPGFDFRHIFVRVYLHRANDWMALDPTAKAYPMGWEVPNKKERVYNV